MSLRKPFKACDWEQQHARFPVIGMPKLDGVRGLVQQGKLYSRTLKLHPNLHNQAALGKPENEGLDGELILGDPTRPLQCNLVGSAIGRVEGKEDVDLWAFDYITAASAHMPYFERLLVLQNLHGMGTFTSTVKLVPWVMLNSLEELMLYHKRQLAHGYEGTIVRDPKAMHKEGRSTAREGGYLRLKEWTDSEILVTGIKEGAANNNVAFTNELGRTARSTHKENKVPNGLVGTIVGWDRELNMELNCSPGTMTEKERKFYFENQHLIVGKFGKVKYMMYGMKDKPRFVEWMGFRNKEEM